MRIKRLYIGDFGILRNQILEDLNPGLVVIGGLNRAGKSTFMEVLRHLGYGFSQSRTLPPPSGKGYEVEADLALEDSRVYNLRIQGYGEPTLTKISGDDGDFISFRTLYGVDEFTYRQLFTISLQQLDKIPREISGKDVEKLQSMLLGAGFTELIRLPVIESEMLKEAEKIGGKRGSPNVKLFKPYYQQIQEGVRLKKKALNQVEIYQNKKEELANIGDLIKQKEHEIEEIQILGAQLDAIKGNFGVYMEKKELENKMNLNLGKNRVNGFPIHILEKIKALQVSYQEIVEQCAQQTARFKEAVGEFISDKAKEMLLTRRQHIERWMAELSGIREKIGQYHELAKEHRNKKSDLIARMKGFNRNWEEEDLAKIAALPIDGIREGEFLESLEEYKALNEERKDLKQTIDELEENEKLLADRLKRIDASNPNPAILLKRYLYGAVALVIAGAFSAYFSWNFGLLAAIAGIIGIGLYLFVQMSSRNGDNARRQEIESQLEGIRTRIDAAIARNKSLGQQWRLLDEIISEYRNLMGLRADVSPDVIKEYFNAVRNIREKFLELKGIEEQIAQLESGLESCLRDLSSLLGELEGRVYPENDSEGALLISQSEYIFATLNKWHERLREALILDGKERERTAMEMQIGRLIDLWGDEDRQWKTFDERLNAFIDIGEKVGEYLKLQQEYDILNRQLIHSLSMDRTRNALLADSNFSETGHDMSKNIVDKFENMCIKYGTIDEVEQEWQQNKERLQKEREELERLKERHLRLQDELNSLATMENLEMAQRQIDQGRNGLRPIAYQYAVYNAAAFIIGRVRQNLLDEVKDMVLGKAAQILRRMTNGEYAEILPPDNWMEPDFKTVLKEGAVQESVDILSQGTREQLYLAVRISRILDIKPPLPVILDDCMANFDSRHVRESVKVLSELAQTHQVFMLTCHPELVEAVADCTPNAQYWSLNRGRFALSSSEKLVSHLAT